MNFLYGHALWGKKVNEQISNSKIDFFRFFKEYALGKVWRSSGRVLGGSGMIWGCSVSYRVCSGDVLGV